MWAGMNNDITKPMFFSLNTVRKKGTKAVTGAVYLFKKVHFCT